jgi:S1-C subfamily serine protease
VLTNAHNLRDRSVAVTFADGRAEQGAVHGIDVDGDLVVLAVPTAGTAALELGDATASVGSVVVALARGGHRARASVGFVSGVGQSFRGPRGRTITGSLEHTAPISRGASGGPVFDRSRRVVAVNTHRSGDGFYLARAGRRPVPHQARRAPRRTVSRTAHARRRTRARPTSAATMRRAVGLPERAGLLVRGVEEGGPAGRAGVQVGDLLVAAGGNDVHTLDDLTSALDRVTGDSIDIGLVRGVEDLVVHVSFGPDAE